MDKERERAWRKKYRAESPHYREYVASYLKKNRSKLKEYRRNYYQAHKAETRQSRMEYFKNRKHSNLAFRIRVNLSSSLNRAIRQKQKAGKTVEMLGCSIPDFQIYIESKFEVGMSWENYGRGDGKWHLDHIVPCAIFDLTKPEHQRRCFHFSNYQPLWQPDNLSKCKRPVASQFQLL